MKSLIYNNINCTFTFENVCSQLTKFWVKESPKKYSKIWLTIIVCNKYNRSFILIRNLPFNTSDYTDVVIVLKQVFNTNTLSNRKDNLKNIVFKYHFENEYNWKVFFKNISIYLIYIFYIIFLVFINFILFFEVSQLFNLFETINNDVLVIYNESIVSSDIYKENSSLCTKRSIFGLFTELFKVTNSYYEYCPSYFISNNLIYVNGNISLDYNVSKEFSHQIILKQFGVIDNIVKSYTEYYNRNESLMHDLNAIRTEFTYYKRYCL